MAVVPETHSDVFDGTKLIVQTLNSVGLGELGGKVNGKVLNTTWPCFV